MPTFNNIASDYKTFWVNADRIVPAQNKYILTLFNTSSTAKVMIHEIYIYDWQSAGVTGVLLEFELKRITARTSGTSLTISPFDTDDTLTSGITADHTSTAVTDSSLFVRSYSTGEEISRSGTSVNTEYAMTKPLYANAYTRHESLKGIVLRQNQGFTIKQITNSTAGSVSAQIIFTEVGV